MKEITSWRHVTHRQGENHPSAKSHAWTKRFWVIHMFDPGVNHYIFHPGARQENIF